MPWDRKRLLGYVETIQLLLRGTDKKLYEHHMLFLFADPNPESFDSDTVFFFPERIQIPL